MSTGPPRKLLIDVNLGWREDKRVTPPDDEMSPFLVQKSIAPDYDWSKLTPPPSEEFSHNISLFRCAPGETVLKNSWHDIRCAADDNGFVVSLNKGEWADVFYIKMATLPCSAAGGPYIFRKASRFCELLATTCVPPSMVMQILNGDLGHRYLPIGRQEGGLCWKHDIPQATFLKRYERFTKFINDVLDTLSGVTLYLTPHLEQEMDEVIDHAKRCILNDDVLDKKKESTNKLSNYSSFKGVSTCKAHFEQLYKMTCNVDESFEGNPGPLRRWSSYHSGVSNQVNSQVSSMFAGTQDKCVVCKKTVYPIEKVGVDGKSYHKACFRCTHGGCVISPSNYVAHEHRLFCKHHHNQLFKQKGNFSQLDEHEKVTE